jgi:hypothetical protein
VFGDLAYRLWGRGWVSAQQGAARRAGERFGFGARDVRERDLRIAGQERVGVVDGGLPGVFDDPDEGAHIESGVES